MDQENGDRLFKYKRLSFSTLSAYTWCGRRMNRPRVFSRVAFLSISLLCFLYIIYATSVHKHNLYEVLDLPNSAYDNISARILFQDSTGIYEFTCTDSDSLEQFFTAAQLSEVNFTRFNRYMDMLLSTGIFDIEVYGTSGHEDFISNRVKINASGNICTYDGYEYSIITAKDADTVYSSLIRLKVMGTVHPS